MADFELIEDFETGDFVKRFGRFLDDPRELLAMFGQDAADLAMESFEQQSFGESGKEWQPRSVPNVAGIFSDINEGRKPPTRRTSSTPALVDTGKLRMSFTFTVISTKTIQVGNNRPNADILLKGGEISQKKKISKAVFDKGIDKFLKSPKGKTLDNKQKKRVERLKKIDELTVTVPARQFLGYNIKRAKEVIVEFLIQQKLK